MPVYTFETYSESGKPRPRSLSRVHDGDFESNRDSLSPAMLSAREFEAASKADALRKGREAARTQGTRFIV